MRPVFLGLGSNLGNRESFLRRAIQALTERGIDVVRTASLYETEPFGVTNQPWYLNTVLEVDTDLQPVELLRQCLSIEGDSGRVRVAGEKAPRTLDLDILYYGNRIIREAGLTIPHPQRAARRFVLLPLVEIAPDFIDPEWKIPIRALAEQTRDTSAVRWSAPPLV